jgi:predicted metal-binding protein
VADAREIVELIACVTCGSAERETHGSTRGERFFAELQAARESLGESPIAVSSTRCLWACTRPCAVHARAPGRAGYMLCDFEPTPDAARGVLEWAEMYAASSDGAVPFKERPQAVRGHFLCRVPPVPWSVSVAEAKNEPAAPAPAPAQENDSEQASDHDRDRLSR